MTDIETISAFACHCGPEGKSAMVALVTEVCTALECEPNNLVTNVAYALTAHDPEISITGIATDQWAGVYAETYVPTSDKETPKVKFAIECDMIEHGFALLWKKVNERFPQEP